jgi:hypothetical protein
MQRRELEKAPLKRLNTFYASSYSGMQNIDILG